MWEGLCAPIKVGLTTGVAAQRPLPRFVRRPAGAEKVRCVYGYSHGRTPDNFLTASQLA